MLYILVSYRIVIISSGQGSTMV